MPETPPVAATAPPGPPPLDRCAAERADEGLLGRLLTDPATAVLELCGGRAPVTDDGAGVRLATRPPAAGDADGLAVFLGRDPGGRAHVAVVIPTPAQADAPADPEARPAGSRWVDVPPRTSWQGPRDVGTALDAGDVERFLTAVALANWHATHPHCPRCGAPTEPALAGWVRRCAADGSEHYPRTDPAVIMAVVDPDDRLLLARNPAWPQGRRSVLAGFVEPGERLEGAVAREVFEEVGVAVTDVRYVASQPWPFPASLMLGFTARAPRADLVLDPVEIAEAEWYTREQVAAGVADGSLGLPGRTSIARRLLEDWYGARLEPAVEVAFHRPDGTTAVTS